MTQRQEFGPFSFEAPAEWTRRPVLSFTDPASPTRLVLTRETLPRGEAFGTFAWRRLFEVSRELPNRRLLDAQSCEAAGRPALRGVLEVESERGDVTREHITWVDAGDGAVLVATCDVGEGGSAEAFEAMVASLRLGAPAASLAPPPAAQVGAQVAAQGIPRAVPPPVVPRAQRASYPPPSAFDESGVYPAIPMPGARAGRR